MVMRFCNAIFWTLLLLGCGAKSTTGEMLQPKTLAHTIPCLLLANSNKMNLETRRRLLIPTSKELHLTEVVDVLLHNTTKKSIACVIEKSIYVTLLRVTVNAGSTTCTGSKTIFEASCTRPEARTERGDWCKLPSQRQDTPKTFQLSTHRNISQWPRYEIRCSASFRTSKYWSVNFSMLLALTLTVAFVGFVLRMVQTNLNIVSRSNAA